jgi:hypothetical protein
LLTLTPLGAAAVTPLVTFDAESVTVDGATPDGEVLFFSVERVPQGFYEAIDIRREVRTADATGLVEIRFDPEVPERSVWAAIDLTTGELALGSPHEKGLLEDPFAAGAFQVDAEGLSDQVRNDHKLVEALWARPASADGQSGGAWRLRISDGGRFDADEVADGSVSVKPSSFKPVSDEESVPERFIPGDVLVMIDPGTLEISAVRLEGERGGEGGEAGGAR